MEQVIMQIWKFLIKLFTCAWNGLRKKKVRTKQKKKTKKKKTKRGLQHSDIGSFSPFSHPNINILSAHAHGDGLDKPLRRLSTNSARAQSAPEVALYGCYAVSYTIDKPCKAPWRSEVLKATGWGANWHALAGTRIPRTRQFNLEVAFYHVTSSFIHMCRFMCRAKWSDLEKHLSQCVHLNGLAPVCFRKCLVSSSLLAKRHTQPSQEHL